MKSRDKGRKWMWWLLGGIASLQFYFVQELVAAFALFVLGFLAVASVTGSLYALYRVWAVTVDRVADSRRPVMVGARRGIDGIGDLARRPFRRPGSEQPAS
jgi:4-hydroxybenzoate polyprenyltransferase